MGSAAREGRGPVARVNQAPVDVPGVASAESDPGRRLAIVVGTALEAAVAGAGCHAAALA